MDDFWILDFQIGGFQNFVHSFIILVTYFFDRHLYMPPYIFFITNSNGNIFLARIYKIQRDDRKFETNLEAANTDRRLFHGGGNQCKEDIKLNMKQ